MFGYFRKDVDRSEKKPDLHSTDSHKPKAGEEKAASDEGNAKEKKCDVPTDAKGQASGEADEAGDAGGVQLPVLLVWLRPFKKE